MGRKDLTLERQTLILDATERCIAKFGLQGTSLEDIADEAGINRGLIHHYVGNRNDVVQLMLERLLKRYQSSFDDYTASRQNNGSADVLVDYYFDAWLELAPEDDAIILSLWAESERDPQIRKVLQKLYGAFERLIAGELRSFFPGVESNRLNAVSYSLMLLAFSHAIMVWLGLPNARRVNLRPTAATLISTLA